MWVVGSPDGFVENALQVTLSQGRALKILAGLDFLGASQRLLIRNRFHSLRAQRVKCCSVFTQIELGAHQDDRDIRGVVVDFGVPLVSQVISIYRPLSVAVFAGSRFRTLALTLSNEGGLTMEKQIRKTSVWGYDKGLRRS